jgi:hypothetical protein
MLSCTAIASASRRARVELSARIWTLAGEVPQRVDRRYLRVCPSAKPHVVLHPAAGRR